MFVVVLVLAIFEAVNVDALVYFYVVHWCRMGRTEVLKWFRAITERHTLTEVLPAYKSLLPPPCVLHVSSNDGERYDAKIVELVSLTEKIVVMAILCPLVGEKRFFAAVGETASLCDAVMMEGVSFERIDKIVPAALIPLQDITFPALGVHHRFIDVARGRREPSFLYPAGLELGFRAYWMQLLVPFE
ncbi:hypothetical protein TraAM80_00167 [Trypanosoma rangeli]|uniref:Uncharacterized protein n=1 Tax=Trypanosoma rangeli TaxID=5698 RepID=A0A3R7MX43_TRYRA|nr:uncharacterized protein TraAM80_00167 [Trypanosoma rangeli]RNF12624.1 hypothetical protein TraAM80_00167 [Trypanosoma rangeli]|eukprot:RNF12624.1 hypothetical protein TraAM80_00167 [Trypanosoma rangeli]